MATKLVQIPKYGVNKERHENGNADIALEVTVLYGGSEFTEVFNPDGQPVNEPVDNMLIKKA